MHEQPKNKNASNKVFLIALAAVVLIVGGVVWWIQQPAPGATPSSLPTPVTGQVAQAVLGVGADAQRATVEELFFTPDAFAGKNVVVSGTLGHRVKTGYGWNLKFDLFDPSGNSVPLVDVDPGTVTNRDYKVTGWVRVVNEKAELHVTQLEYADGA